VIILSWRKRKYTPLGIQKILLGKRDSPWGRENSLSPGKRKSSLGKYRLSLGKKEFSPRKCKESLPGTVIILSGEERILSPGD
jgi:hypothetical protein